MPARRTVRAEVDIASIALGLATTDASAGMRFYERIDEFIDLPGDFPQLGRKRQDIGPTVRLFVLDRRWTVLYQVTPDIVEVLRVLPRGARLSTD